MKHIAFAAFMGVMLQVTAAFAQGQGGGSPVYQNWFPVGTPATLSVTTASARVALPTGGLTARVCNTGSTDAYVVLGADNTVVATTAAGSLLGLGKCQPFNLVPFSTRYTYIAAITGSSSTTLRIEAGLGAPSPSDSSAGALPVGSATAANQTTQITAEQSTATAAGAPADAAVTNPASSASIIASLKGVLTQLQTAQPAGTNNIGTVNGSTVGGYEFNASVIPTTTNASHAAGVAMADLQTISVGSTNSLSGIVTQIQYSSKGGSTSGVVVYLWSKLPAATTCTNGSAIVTSQADNQFLVFPPILLTPALVLSAQDTTTYATVSNLVGNFVNGSSNTNLYECTVSNATQTPATTTDIRVNIQGTKDQP